MILSTRWHYPRHDIFPGGAAPFEACCRAGTGGPASTRGMGGVAREPSRTRIQIISWGATPLFSLVRSDYLCPCASVP